MRALAMAGWAVLAVAAAAWLALVEVFWLPLRVGGVPLPLSVVMAVAGNLLLVDQALRRSGSRAVAVLPALVWAVVSVTAAIRRPEGDLVITGGGAIGVIGLVYLLAGVVAAAFAVGRILARPRPAPPALSVPTAQPDPAGSGSGGAR
jgi:hypothetical protein